MSVRTAVERALRPFPALHHLGSRLYHKTHRAFATLSAQAPETIARAFEVLQQSGVDQPRDYYEFGVFRGYCLLNAQKTCDQLGLDQVRFYGFDSFRGLPKVEGVDQTNAQFFEGQFACGKHEVVNSLTQRGCDWSRTELIEGFFNESLTPALKARHPFKPVAVAMIDCDLYSSTCDVLNWLDGLLADRSILIFDDWRSFGDDRADLGQQKALNEFLTKHTHIKLRHLWDYQRHGAVFEVNLSR